MIIKRDLDFYDFVDWVINESWGCSYLIEQAEEHEEIYEEIWDLIMYEEFESETDLNDFVRFDEEVERILEKFDNEEED